MIRKVISYKSKKIRRISEEIKTFKKLQKLMRDMESTCKAHDGVGLAAIQIGVNKRIVLIAQRDKQHYFLINPVIIDKSEKMIEEKEGCLSAKGKFGNVKRHEEIMFEFTDVKGKRQKAIATEYEARIIQHEMDHIDGVVCIDLFRRTE